MMFLRLEPKTLDIFRDHVCNGVYAMVTGGNQWAAAIIYILYLNYK